MEFGNTVAIMDISFFLLFTLKNGFRSFANNARFKNCMKQTPIKTRWKY